MSDTNRDVVYREVLREVYFVVLDRLLRKVFGGCALCDTSPTSTMTSVAQDDAARR